MIWQTIERPGQLGKKRDELFTLWNKEYGKNNWRIAWEFGKLVLEKKEAIQIYEDAYYEFFKNNPEKLNHLITIASDIYDTDPENVNSYLDYEKQETPDNHIHDIAIRRSLIRLGTWFKGKELIRIRWKIIENRDYDPGKVPFHRQELIAKEEIKDYNGWGAWWLPNTVEDWYQRNKVLQIRK